MRRPSHGRFRRQVDLLRQQFLQEGGLPFTDVLSDGVPRRRLWRRSRLGWNDRIFTPLVTLWVFLGQVLSADHSCRAAVARLIAHRVAQGLPPCSSETGAYCQARKRLPLSDSSPPWPAGWGRPWTPSVDPQWLWKGRRVYLFDGSSVAMPDTPENRREYPLTYNQKPGTGFAVARIGAVISLACGAILDLGICRYAGKGQSESGLLRQLWDLFRPGDVMVGGSPDVRLDRDGDAQAARRRHRLPPDVAPHGRLPPRDAARQGRSHRRVDEAERSPGRSTGRPTTRCPSS